MRKPFYIVSDAVSNQNTGGFVDGNTSLSLDDYEYDANGNLILDRNKGIESITYNYLNLPVKVTWSNKKHITYQYTAAGQKVKKTVRDNDSIKIVDYLDGFQYAGNVLQFFPHGEGYVKVSPNPAQSINMFNYVFNYTDHLGNVRVSYTKDPQTRTLEILDENHYYPFGLQHGVYVHTGKKEFKMPTIGDANTPVLEQVIITEYQYKYNEKELQDELGLDWYDYGARNYDPALGRWMNIDPLAEEFPSWSPYTFVYNNPIKFIDPTGMAPMHDYKLLQNGDVKLIRETNDNSDTLYSTNELGQVTSESNSFTIAKNNAEDTSIIGELSSGRSMGMSIDLTPPGNIGFFSEGFTNNLNTAFSLFNFLDNNTKSGIEFSLSKYSVGGNDMFQIATMHKIDSSRLTSNRFSTLDMIWSVHNHDGEVGLMYKQIGNQWDTDKRRIQSLIKDAKSNKLGFPRMFTVNDANQMIEVKWTGADTSNIYDFNASFLSTLNRVYKSN